MNSLRSPLTPLSARGGGRVVERAKKTLDKADAIIERSAVRFVDEGDHPPVSFCGVFSGIMYLTEHNDSVFSLDIPRDLAIESGR